MHARDRFSCRVPQGWGYALHIGGPRDHAMGLILELGAASLQEQHHRTKQLCAMAS